MKNLKTILVLAFVVIVSSCSKSEDEPAATPTAIQYRIKEKRNSNNQVETSYLYNAQNQETRAIYATYTSNTSYNSAGKKIKVTIEQPNTFTQVTDFIYDANNKLTDEIETYSNAKTKISYAYGTNSSTATKYTFNTANSNWVQVGNSTYNTFNSNNQIIETIYDGIGPQAYPAILKVTSEYDSRGNVSLSTAYVQLSSNEYRLFGQTKYVYDDIKPTNYTNSILFKNNVVEATSKSFNNSGSVTSTGTEVYTYEYNPEGNVTKKTINGVAKDIYILEKID